jgi:hypothetical protein
MVDECQIAVDELTRDRAMFQREQIATLSRIILQREMSPVRKEVMTAISEVPFSLYSHFSPLKYDVT